MKTSIADNNKEVFEEPSCELVDFSFEDILASDSSNMLPDDYFV